MAKVSKYFKGDVSPVVFVAAILMQFVLFIAGFYCGRVHMRREVTTDIGHALYGTQDGNREMCWILATFPKGRCAGHTEVMEFDE